MKLSPTISRRCSKHITITTQPCLVTELTSSGKYKRYWLIQTKCGLCGKVFEEKKKEVK